MKVVELRLDREAVAPLIDLIRDLAAELGGTLAVLAVVPDADGEFAGDWERDLLTGQNDDIGAFLELFGGNYPETGLVVIDLGNAEAVIRACSALRLRLRATRLKSIDDSALETGEVPLDKLADFERQGFACHVFLATLQELAVRFLDPSASEE